MRNPRISLRPHEWDYVARALIAAAHRDVLSDIGIGRMELQRLARRIAEIAKPLVSVDVETGKIRSVK
jgi:hypothetical protein